MLLKTPVGMKEVIATFGDPTAPRFEAQNIVSFLLPYPLLYEGKVVKRARCHKLIVDNFQKVFEELKAAGLDGEVKNYGGIYNFRPQRKGSKPSTHSWGIAIDLEPLKYPQGSKARFPDRVIEIFAAAGFFYGSDFQGTPDPMHFQFAKGY